MYKAGGIWFSFPKKQMFKCVNLKIVPQAWWAVSFGKQSFTCATFSRQWEGWIPRSRPIAMGRGEPWRFKVRSGAMISMGGRVYYIVGSIFYACEDWCRIQSPKLKYSTCHVFQGLDVSQLPKKKNTARLQEKHLWKSSSKQQSWWSRKWHQKDLRWRRRCCRRNSPESWLMFFGDKNRWF